MKNYNEMADSIFERRGKFETEKKKRKKLIIKTVTPICCLCLVVLTEVGIWHGRLHEEINIMNLLKHM